MKLLHYCVFAHLGIYTSLFASAAGQGIFGPKQYRKGAEVKLFVHELRSIHTQAPLKYYDLPFCPLEGKHPKAYYGGLGQMLEGRLTQESSYKLKVQTDTSSDEILCRRFANDSLTSKEMSMFLSKIQMGYFVYMSVGSIPMIYKRTYRKEGIFSKDGQDEFLQSYLQGFPLGYVGDGENVYINNHISIEVQIHPVKENPKTFNIVKVLVKPLSVDHEKLEGDGLWDKKYNSIDESKKNDPPPPKKIGSLSTGISKTDKLDITFTYDVTWTVVDRWDRFNDRTDDQVQWSSNIHSFEIVILLTGLVAMILMRTLRRDIQRYNAEDIEDAKEEFGWKLVHGDVFRPPRAMPTVFAVSVGTGVQLLATVFLFVLLGCIGFIPVVTSGSALTAGMVIFVFMGSLGGYVSARIHRMFRGTDWLKTTALTSSLYPGFCLSIFTIVTFAEKIFSNSVATFFGPVILVLLLWFTVQAPLVFIGSYYGFKKEPLTDPVRTNQIPRQIPPKPWYMSPYISIPICGFLPFGAVLVEFIFIMNELWLSEVYSIFGFLLASGVLLVLTCTEIAIVMCYFQLCAEDYNWWWRSLQWAGSCSLYFLLYAVIYQSSQLQISTWLGILIYFGYCTLIAVSFGLATSATGFFACYYFIRTIMASIKVRAGNLK